MNEATQYLDFQDITEALRAVYGETYEKNVRSWVTERPQPSIFFLASSVRHGNFELYPFNGEIDKLSKVVGARTCVLWLDGASI